LKKKIGYKRNFTCNQRFQCIPCGLLVELVFNASTTPALKASFNFCEGHTCAELDKGFAFNIYAKLKGRVVGIRTDPADEEKS